MKLAVLWFIYSLTLVHPGHAFHNHSDLPDTHGIVLGIHADSDSMGHTDREDCPLCVAMKGQTVSGVCEEKIAIQIEVLQRPVLGLSRVIQSKQYRVAPKGSPPIMFQI